MKNKEGINWTGLFILIGYSSLLGFLALGLPQKICTLNGLLVNCGYGRFAAYVCIMLLFWIFTKDIKLTLVKEGNSK